MPAQVWGVLAGASPCKLATVGMLQRQFHAAMGVAGFGHPELGEVTWRGGSRVSLRSCGKGVVLGCCPLQPVQRVLEQAGKKGRESALPAFPAGLAELSSTCS